MVRLAVGLVVSLLTAFAGASLRPRTPQPRSYDTHQYYALELSPDASASSADAAAAALSLELVEPLGELAGHWLVRREAGVAERSAVSRASDVALARWADMRARGSQLRSLAPLDVRQRAKRAGAPHATLRRSSRSLSHGWERDDAELLFAQNDLHLADPILAQQWHLINTDMPEFELNVTGLWSSGVTGDGVKVVIVDDGLDMDSDDLAANFYADGSYDFNDHTELPKPRLSDDQHGTRCAGEIAAVPNDVCGVGVAYNAKIAGVRILSAPISDADEAAALNYAYQLNEIYSCSWGPPDDGKSMEAPEGLILKALVNGVQNGRDGKGSVFVFAAGNGGGVDDQCNFDGYTNSIFSITVGAVDRKGMHPYYSEMCAAMMIVAPSSGSGKDKCAHNHGGTSAAAPLAVGVFALALEVRPDLSWRDLQHLCVNHAVHFNPSDPDWEKTSAGRMFSYKYGYGRIDAGIFVEAAKSWDVVKPQAWFDSPAVYLPDDPETAAEAAAGTPGTVRRQDDGDAADTPTATEPAAEPAQTVPVGSVITEDGLTSTYEVTQGMLDDSNFERLEHVTARVWIDHQRRGDVEVELKSPSGIVSILAKQRRFDEDTNGYPGWKFMTLKHWDEKAVGTWTITVRDRVNPEKTGRFIAWSLQLWGESVDASKAKPWAPAEYGQPDEEETGSDPTAVVSQKPKPTEYLPDDHAQASGEATQTLGATATAGDDIAVPTGDGGDEETGPSDAEADEGWFDGIESLASSSAWLAGAGLIVVLAGGGAALFLILRARRRSRSRNLFGLANSGEGGRGAYQPVSEDVPMGLLERGRRKLGMRGRGEESKELYDAFGDGPSDDEEEDDGASPRLRYHDDFLEDDEAEHERGQPPRVRDEPSTSGAASPAGRAGDSNGSSGSWHDAAEDVGRT